MDEAAAACGGPAADAGNLLAPGPGGYEGLVVKGAAGAAGPGATAGPLYAGCPAPTERAPATQKQDAAGADTSV